MPEHSTIARNDGWRDAGRGLRVRGPKASRLVVSPKGELRGGGVGKLITLESGTLALERAPPVPTLNKDHSGRRNAIDQENF